MELISLEEINTQLKGWALINNGIEKDFEFEDGLYNENAVLLSKYADIRLLEKRRRVFQEAGIWEGVVDQGLSMEIQEYDIAVKCIGAGIEPPEEVFLCIFGDYDIAMDAKRTLEISLSTGEVTTTYSLKYDPERSKVSFTKSITRTYGSPEFNRWGAMEEASAMIESVCKDVSVTNAEFEILYVVVDYVANRNCVDN